MPKFFIYGGKRRSDDPTDVQRDDKDNVSSSSDLEPSSDMDTMYRKRKWGSRDSINASPESSSSANDRLVSGNGHVTQDVTNRSILQRRLSLFSANSSAFDVFNRLPSMHSGSAASGASVNGTSFMSQPFSLFNSYPPVQTYVSESGLPLQSSSAGISPRLHNVAMVPLLPWQGLSPGQVPASARRASDTSAILNSHAKLDLNISFNEYFENMKNSLEKYRQARQIHTLSAPCEKEESDSKENIEFDREDVEDKEECTARPLNYVKGECDVNVDTSDDTGLYWSKRRRFSAGSETDMDDETRSASREAGSPSSPASLHPEKSRFTPHTDPTTTSPSTSALSATPLTSSSAPGYVRSFSDPLSPDHPSHQNLQPHPDPRPHPASHLFPIDKLLPSTSSFALASLPGVQIPPPAAIPATHPAHGHPLLTGHLTGGIGVAGSPGVGYFHPALMHLGGLGVTRRPACDKPPAVKKYKCDVCDKAFSRSNTLVTHKRIHTGDKPFKCERCGRAFRQPGNLTRHRLTHTTHKPYVCPQCGKAFNRASNLNTHMRTHSNVRPFPCVMCGKAFSQKVDLRMHMYSHGGEQHSALRPVVRH